MPAPEDLGRERVDLIGDRWILCAPVLGNNRPRIGWTQRWLPAVVVEVTDESEDQDVRCRWELRQWYDWATGDQIEVTTDPLSLVHEAEARTVRRRTPHAWNIPKTSDWSSNVLYPRCGTEMAVGGCEVAVSFIVFQWGAAKIGVQYDSHSWGASEGSTVSNRFIQKFFQDAVIPKFQCDYEVLTVFIQHSDEFAGISPEFLASLCRGRTICALYFLWPIQGYQSYGEKIPMPAGYVTADPFFHLVSRMEASGIPTRWPHPVQLWKLLTSKDWISQLCSSWQFQIPLTTRISKALVLLDPGKAARSALAALRVLQRARQETWKATHSDWGDGEAALVVKLGYSYEAADVRMVKAEAALAEAMYCLVTQPNYTNDCVYVQERVRTVHLEARCFVLNGEVVNALFTRFARVDCNGYVRDYEKSSSSKAQEDWLFDDAAAFEDARSQMKRLCHLWHLWLLAQSAEPTVSVRIDFLVERVAPGKAEVWTCEVGEQGYSMEGIDPAMVFKAVVDTV
ncbi:RPS9B [Symbiodinium natans]|uniref:RPS9B protein n=1 Tax=Symbiodinium natans TaxID=878477 RepID=A0A812MXK5_9DINO|nr:RPS9B [Symbiodinium natans]